MSPSLPCTVNSDLYCIHCDYNLRTLWVQYLCPECGRPIKDSLDAERRWIGVIRCGLVLLMSTLAWSGLTAVSLLPRAGSLLQGLDVLFTTVGMVGVMLVTRWSPYLSRQDAPTALRITARMLAAGMFLSQILLAAILFGLVPCSVQRLWHCFTAFVCLEIVVRCIAAIYVVRVMISRKLGPDWIFPVYLAATVLLSWVALTGTYVRLPGAVLPGQPPALQIVRDPWASIALCIPALLGILLYLRCRKQLASVAKPHSWIMVPAC